MRRHRFRSAAATWLGMRLATAGVVPDLTLLSTPVGDRPVDVHIGTSGALLGEQVLVDARLSAGLMAAGPVPTRSQVQSQTSVGATRIARFEIPGGWEVPGAGVRWHFSLLPMQLDRFVLGIREQAAARKCYADMAPASNSRIFLSNAADPGDTRIGTYIFGNSPFLNPMFRMDRHEYRVCLDGAA